MYHHTYTYHSYIYQFLKCILCPIKDISIFIQTCTCMLNQLQLQLKQTHLQTLFFRLQAFQVWYIYLSMSQVSCFSLCKTLTFFIRDINMKHNRHAWISSLRFYLTLVYEYSVLAEFLDSSKSKIGLSTWLTEYWFIFPHLYHWQNVFDHTAGCSDSSNILSRW